jgi:hypothetical protein
MRFARSTWYEAAIALMFDQALSDVGASPNL